MIARKRFGSWAVIWLVMVAAVQAQDLQTTTEFGVTITADDITNAIQETQDFWGPVRNHVAGETFDVAPQNIRKAAVAFITTVQDELHSRLFERDEAAATDLINYLTHRLRKFAVYRQIRGAINNDAVMVVLLERWEKANRDINALPEADRSARVEALLKLMPDEMAAAGLSADVIATAQNLWETQSQVLGRMNGTETGKMMISYEHTARTLPSEIGDVIRSVTTAADWALINKSGEGSITRKDFDVAWQSLTEMRAKRLVSKNSTDLK